MSEHPSSEDLLARAKVAIDLGGPPPPWTAVGVSSIRFPSGVEMHCQSNGNHVNAWTRQRICEAIELLPLMVSEIERLNRRLYVANEKARNDEEQIRDYAARLREAST